MSETTQELHDKFEPHPDPHSLTRPNIDQQQQNQQESSTTRNVSTGPVDYTPHPSDSLPISPTHQHIVTSITNLYSGSASETDMSVYSPKAIYDDPVSYCDTRYKIAGQWHGLPKLFSKLETLSTQVVKDTDDEIVFKLQQRYELPGGVGHTVDSLVSLGLAQEEGTMVVKYHKDMWNEKDYNHKGFGMLVKKLNGDHLTKITKPPEDL